MNILVPTDFSQMADNALAYAAMLASRLDARIILLHIVPPNSIWWTSFNDEIISEARERQAVIRKKLIDDGMHPDMVAAEVIDDFPLNRSVNRFLSEHQVDFIVMGTHGSGLSSAMLGSFTMGMIEHVNIPVLAVPPDAKDHSIRHMLYATDMEDLLSETRRIAGLAKVFKASIHILHIPAEDAGTQLLAGHELADIARRTGYEPITTEVAREHSVRDAIRNRLADGAYDLLVMVAHKKGVFERLFRGSRTNQMSTAVSIPLLVYQKQEKKG